MPAYIVGRMRIHEREWMDEYFAEVPGVVEQYKGRFLVRGGNPQRLEGEESVPDATFVVEFPTREDAQAFWVSPEFAPLIKLRQTGSRLEAMVVDGQHDVLES